MRQSTWNTAVEYTIIRRRQCASLGAGRHTGCLSPLHFTAVCLVCPLISSRAEYGGNVADFYFPNWQLLHVLCLRLCEGWILYIDDAVKRTKNAIFVLISTKFSPKSLIWSEAAMNPSLKLVQLCAADVSYFYSRILHHNRHILKTLKDHCVWSEWICTSFHRFVCFQYENVLSAADNT